MDLKKIVNLCKKRSAFCVNKTTDDCQWFGDGHAMFLLSPEIPFLSADVISGLYELDKDKLELNYKYKLLDSELQLLADIAEDEELLVPLNINVIYGGKTLLPFKSSQGLILIDIDYLKPLGVNQYELTFTLRSEKCVAVKKGMFVTAIITAFDCNRDDDFFEVIKQLYKLNSVSREKEFMKNKNFDEMEGVNDVCDN